MFSVIFPGQGSQSVGMANELYNKFEIFKINYKKAEEHEDILSIISYKTINSMKISPMYPGFQVKNKDGSDMVSTFRNILADQKVRYVGEPVLALSLIHI